MLMNFMVSNGLSYTFGMAFSLYCISFLLHDNFWFLIYVFVKFCFFKRYIILKGTQDNFYKLLPDILIYLFSSLGWMLKVKNFKIKY